MKKSLLLLSILLAALPCTAKGQKEGEKTDRSREEVGIEKIVIAGPRSPASLPALWLQENRLSEEQPEVRVELYASMEAMMAMMQSKEIDFLLMPTNAASVFHNKEFDITMLNIFHWGGMFLSSTDPACRSWADLAGKELYVPSKGSVPDMTTQVFLKHYGLTPGRDLTVVYSNHGEIAQLLSSGSISYAVDVQPFVAAHLSDLRNYHVISEYSEHWQQVAGEGNRMPGFCMVSKKKEFQENAGFLHGINDLFEAAVTAVIENPAEAGEMAQIYMNANPGIVAQAIGRFGFSFMPMDQAIDHVERYYAILHEMKPAVIGGALPERELYLTHGNR